MNAVIDTIMMKLCWSQLTKQNSLCFFICLFVMMICNDESVSVLFVCAWGFYFLWFTAFVLLLFSVLVVSVRA